MKPPVKGDSDMMRSRSSLYIPVGKRVLDCVVSALALFLLFPLLAAVAVLVKLRLGSPILFRQVRPGLKGCPFIIVKFKSMTDEHDSQGGLLPDAQRLTPFGSFLRKTSLDELPELFNVLKGDMSLVGPRPLKMEYLPLYSADQARRHEVRPGITGWAQINGRNDISWDEKFAHDVWYVENVSLWLDVKILVATLVPVLLCKGIGSTNPFRGRQQ